MMLGEPGPGPAPCTRIERTRLCMGVPARVTVDFEPGREAAAEAAIDRAFVLLAALDADLSDYRLDSELNRVNAAAGAGAVSIGEPLMSVLRVSAKVAAASDGAFDATVGPAAQLWRRARKTGELAGEPELAAARRLVDWRSVELDPAAGAARLTTPGMRLDLGAIGKGFAAQRAVDQLKVDGFPRAMVALAGDIAVGDPPRGTKGWSIEVSPSDDRGIGQVVPFANQAISTSGGAEQFVEIAGRRYSHIVDPRTGLGSPVGVTVSVIAPRGEWADALSTAAAVVLARGGGGESELAVARMLGVCPGSRAIVERRADDGRAVRSEIEPAAR